MRKNTNGLPTLKEAEKEAAKASAAQKSRRYKKAGIIAVVVAVVIVLGFMAYNYISSAQANDSRIPSLVPANADTVVLTPSSSDWWSDVTNMAPLTFGVNELDPYAAGLQIKTLGYARADDVVERDVRTTDPVRSIYVESPTEEDAAKVEAWLKESAKSEARAVYRNGTVVQITHNWIKEFEVPTSNVESRGDYSLGEADTEGVMWVNYANQVDSLAGADNPQKALVASYLKKSFALKDGTVWSGKSNDGITWNGKYTSGGVDMNLYDPEAARQELVATQEEIVSKEETNGKGSIVDNGLFSFIINSGVKKTGENTNYGAVEVTGVENPVNDEKLAAIIEPSQWNRAALGTGALTEGVRKMSLSMSNSEMTMVLIYGGYAMTPDMPEFQSPSSTNRNPADNLGELPGS